MHGLFTPNTETSTLPKFLHTHLICSSPRPFPLYPPLLPPVSLNLLTQRRLRRAPGRRGRIYIRSKSVDRCIVARRRAKAPKELGPALGDARRLLHVLRPTAAPSTGWKDERRRSQDVPSDLWPIFGPKGRSFAPNDKFGSFFPIYFLLILSKLYSRELRSFN